MLYKCYICCDRYLLRLFMRMYVVLVDTDVELQPMSCIDVCPICMLHSFISLRPILVVTNISCD